MSRSRRRRSASLLIVMTVASLAAVGCDDTIKIPSDVVPSSNPVVTEVRVAPSHIELTVGSSQAFAAAVLGTNLTNFNVSWSTSSASVATMISAGVATCVAPGTASIIATSAQNPNVRGFATLICRDAGNLIGISAGSLQFTHQVQATACPQPIGTIRVTNESGGAVQVTVNPRHAALTVDPTSFSLGAGESREVAVSFNCGTQQSFTAAMTIAAQGGSVAESESVTVTGTINP